MRRVRPSTEVRSDGNGRFELVGLPSGDYVLATRVPGFAGDGESIAIAGEDLSHNIRLRLGSLQETIFVQDASESAGSAVPAPAREVSPARTACTASSAGGQIRPPKKIRDVVPQYPPALKGSGIDGTVTLDARVGTDGSLKDIRVVDSPHPLLADAAVTAVREWRYTPTLLNCVPVEPAVTTRVTFGAMPPPPPPPPPPAPPR